MISEDAFNPFEKLIEIDILGRHYLVPENNSILRGFQFLNSQDISEGEFCWNGECINCQVWIRNGEKEKMVMACRTDVFDQMQIVRLGETLDTILDPEEPR